MSPCHSFLEARLKLKLSVQGFVLDGFPATHTQAVLLERALSGLDLDSETAFIAQASVTAPPPPDALPNLTRSLVSGLDAVLFLALPDAEVVVKRALGGRIDPLTGIVYHMEYDPPPPKEPGLTERLQVISLSERTLSITTFVILFHPTQSFHFPYGLEARRVRGSSS